MDWELIWKLAAILSLLYVLWQVALVCLWLVLVFVGWTKRGS